MYTIADLSILVVEDQPLQRAFALGMLAMLGAVNVREAEDGLQATVMLKEQPADLIFCDIGMPNMDGPQFVLAQVEHAQSASAGTPMPMLVWMSALDCGVRASHMQMARSAGFEFVEGVAKPLALQALQELIGAALAWRNADQVRYRLEPACRPLVTELRDGGSRDIDISEDDIMRVICNTSEFEVLYQPQVSLDTRVIIGAEAMVRWNHPRFSTQTAEKFVTLIEQQGLGLMLFYRTVNHVFKTQQQLQKIGCNIPIWVKASALTLEVPEIADYLSERLSRYQLRPSLLTIGVSENDLPSQALKLAASLNRLRIKGFGVAIDDFGSGLSTMKLLSQMPFTEIRIDRYFVDQLSRQTPCKVMIESIIDIARRLNIKVMAEGVENSGQLEALQALGCNCGQGAIAEPMMQGDFLTNIGANRLFSGNLMNA
ncbi:EAL domain-containing response regulator [Herbaspirillum autotrophicum]|uniref:EAL domain-containing response regulator n=1 Tax=Herbaspirillum autotrophicum TaxID=180195 RepID=UPI00067DCE45|nr:EAL domain-containing response regulator [Herbaspirillum autotrophicum]